MARETEHSSKKSTHTSSTSTVTLTSNKKALSQIKSFYESVKNIPLLGIVVAEFIGAFIITASFIEMQGNPLFFGFALAGTVLVVGGVSGAHLNPAVTVGAWVTRKISSVYAFFYIVAQLLGATVAWIVLDTFLKGSSENTTNTLFHASKIVVGKEWYLFFAELIGVAILSLGVATAIRLRRNKLNAAFAAGFAVLTALYLTLSLTTTLLTESGVSFTFLNPAIAIAANAITNWDLWPIAIYIVAPVLGGVIGFALQEYLYSQSDKTVCEDCNC